MTRPLAAPVVDLWLVDLTADPLAAPTPDPLTPEETARAARFRDALDRDRWAASRRVLRRLLAAATGADPSTLRLVAGPFGKPSLADDPTLDFSLSRAGGHALIGLARDTRLGVDLVARAAAGGLLPTANWVLSPEERVVLDRLPPPEREPALLRHWAAKEAYLKGTGLGLSRDPATITLHPQPDAALAVDDPAEPLPLGWRVRLADPTPGLLAAVATPASPPARLTWHDRPAG